MCPEASAPAFAEFLSFVASKSRDSQKESKPSAQVLAAARSARRQVRALGPPIQPANRASAPDEVSIEVLELLAASSRDTTKPSELVTVRGFRVRLDYRESTDSAPSSICVLIQCPEPWIERVQGRIAYLWNGTERFELGEFDADGKAIGTLPAGIEITLTDFATGQVKLETPDVPEHD